MGASRFYFSIRSARDVQQNLRPIVHCVEERLPYGIVIPSDFKYYDEIVQMIKRREPGNDTRSRSEAIRDIFLLWRPTYYYSLLAVGFGSQSFKSKFAIDDKGVTVFFDPIPK